jgi:hypothetical protein
MTPVQERLAAMGLDYNVVLNWEGRSKRVRKPPPVTYWEEYVATDDWYINELIADVPENEMKAAFEDDVTDEETSDDESYSDDEEDESDASDSSDEGGDDEESTDDDASDATDDECSDECSESDATSDSEADAEADGPPTKRQR